MLVLKEGVDYRVKGKSGEQGGRVSGKKGVSSVRRRGGAEQKYGGKHNTVYKFA